MDYSLINSTFMTDLSTWWPTAGNTPIAYDNVPFNDNGSSYIVAAVVPADVIEFEYGYCGKVDVTGNFTVRVVTNVQQGYGEAYSLAEQIANRYSRRAMINAITTLASRIERLGQVENKYQLTVIVPFTAVQEAR